MEEALIMEKIWELFRRYRLASGWRTIARSSLFGLLASAFYVLFSKLTGFLPPHWAYYFLPAVLGLLSGILAHRLGRTTLMEVALKSDGRLNLKERLSTALEWIQDGRVRTPMFRGLLRDTASSATAINPPTVFPVAWKKPAVRLSAGLATVSLLFFLPNFSLLAPRVSPDEVKLIHHAAQKIEVTAKKLQQKAPLLPRSHKKLERAARTLNRLASELKQPGMGRKEALVKISKAQEEMKSLAGAKSQAEKAQEEERTARAQGAAKDFKDEQELLSSLSQALKNIAQKADSKDPQAKNKEDVVKSLEKVKEQMKKSGMDTGKIDKAIDAAKQDDMKGAAREAGEMAEQFQQRQSDAEEQQGLEEAGQDLESTKEAVSGREMMKQFQGQKAGEKKEGKGKADFGTTSTNKEEKSGKEPGSQYAERHSQEKNLNRAFHEKLYTPQREKTNEAATGKVKGKLSPGPVVKSLNSRIRGAPRPGDRASTDPVENFVNYRSQGEEEVNRDKIPTRYRELIRNYYDDISPAKK